LNNHLLTAPIAYIGPGAGFALGGSLLTLLLALFANIVSILAWPFRAVWGALRHGRALRRAKIRKLIFIGFDGLDPRLTEQWMSEGKLPNLARLRETGGYKRLRTTYPALSPVAWSTFATGVNPAKHNIFDFLNRSLESYAPELSMAQVTPPVRKWRRPRVESLRRSQSFWTILGRHQIQSTVLRVPVTFPAEKFNGRMISAMCTPDLKGTQGSFTLFTTGAAAGEMEGGVRSALERRADGLHGWLEGPAGLKTPFRVSHSSLHIQNQQFPLRPHEFTPWIQTRFGHTSGIVRFLAKDDTPEFTLYASPVQIDPENPAMPISHPAAYSVYLAKLFGSFATLGLAEDTWALNEGALGERDFLNQAYSIFEERRAMFADALSKTRRGVAGCVFDTSDRVQHMFFRQMSGGREEFAEFGGAIEEMYGRMDAVVGHALRYVDSRTLLLVLSDHGFRAFNRGVNLNAWLREHGYLNLAGSGGKHFEGVDWTGTRAYALGLGGLYLNLRGREAEGIVEPGAEARELKAELIRELTGLKDDVNTAIANMYDAEAIYAGPYLDRAPDLIPGFSDGYRTAWGAAIGCVSGPVFETNDKPWSGDHCVDPPLVPGVLFANRKIDAGNPGLEDLAPTILQMFGVDPPAWMEGKPVFQC
jgi:predicted AlkP superfamily phosphohydrolase/phosphomutase